MRQENVRRQLAKVVLLLVGLFYGCCAPYSAPPQVATTNELPKQLRHRQVVVVLAPAPEEQWAGMIAALQQQYTLEQVGAFPLASLGVQCVVFRIPDERPLTMVLQQLRTDPLVEMAQPNQSFKGLEARQDDPYIALQYGLPMLQAHRAHRVVTGKGVQIASIDTGVAINHPDLQGQISLTANFVEGGDTSFQDDSHGTAVAGVMVAKAGNTTGIRGIAPDARVVALKACWHQAGNRQALCSSWTLARALDFAIVNQVRVVNLSLSGPEDALLRRLLRRAEERGIFIVAAVPPEGDAFPASMETVIAVFPNDRHGQVQGSVAPLPKTAVAAPGVEILTTLPQQAYDFVSGSSLATAYMSGLLALLLERFPALSPQVMRQALQSLAGTASDSSSISRPDACALLQHLASTPLCSLPETEQQGTSRSLPVSLKAP